jgi:predicted ABC-type ATPase
MSFKKFLLENRVVTPEVPYNNLIVIMGLPGAGKSTVFEKGLLNIDNAVHVTPDKWIELFAKINKKDLTNPKHTAEIYKNISNIHRGFTGRIIKPEARSNFVLETLGRNPFNIQSLIIRTKKKGMRVVLVYVRTSLQAALENNRERKRVIPEEVITDTFKSIENSFRILRSSADVNEAWVIDNTNKPTYDDFRTSDFIRKVK